MSGPRCGQLTANTTHTSFGQKGTRIAGGNTLCNGHVHNAENGPAIPIRSKDAQSRPPSPPHPFNHLGRQGNDRLASTVLLTHLSAARRKQTKSDITLL